MGHLALIALALAIQNCMVENQENKKANTANSGTTSIEQAFPGRAGETKKGYLYGAPIVYQEIEGQPVFGGDIILDPKLISLEPPLGKSSSTGRINSAIRWPNNVVYYTIHSSVTTTTRVTSAITNWEANTNVRFVPWTAGNSSHPNYIQFQNLDLADACFSNSIGMRGGMQVINIGANCTDGNTIHEIGHALGLFHEQSRSTRNQDILVYLNRATQPAQFLAWNDANFGTSLDCGIPCTVTDGWNNGPMDYGSIMMYSSCDFASVLPCDASHTNNAVMTRLDGTIWYKQRTSLSSGDIAGIGTIYPSIWTYLSSNTAKDIGVGANGTAWVVGTNAVAGGFGVWKWNGSTWSNAAGGGGVAIDVDASGNPWLVNATGQVFYHNGTSWIGREAGKGFKDIGVGSNGAVWGISNEAVAGGYNVYKWNGSSWDLKPGAGVRISVDNLGNAWMVNEGGSIYRWNGTGWTNLPSSASDIGCGPDGTTYIIQTSSIVPGGFPIAIWNGSAWRTIPGGGALIDVGPNGNPWLVNTSNQIFN